MLVDFFLSRVQYLSLLFHIDRMDYEYQRQYFWIQPVHRIRLHLKFFNFEPSWAKQTLKNQAFYYVVEFSAEIDHKTVKERGVYVNLSYLS